MRRETQSRSRESCYQDILSHDPRLPTSFPNSGRTLRDDVVDVFLPIYITQTGRWQEIGSDRMAICSATSRTSGRHTKGDRSPISARRKSDRGASWIIFSELLSAVLSARRSSLTSFPQFFRSLGASQETRETGRKREEKLKRLDTYVFVIRRSRQNLQKVSVVSLLQTKPPRDAYACALESIFRLSSGGILDSQAGQFSLGAQITYLL